MNKRKEIYVVLREYCEVVALKILMTAARRKKIPITWKVLTFSVNTDFLFHSLKVAFQTHQEMEVMEDWSSVDFSNVHVLGFHTDMKHDADHIVKQHIPIYQVLACQEVIARPPVFDIALGNIKISSPVEEFQSDLFEKVAQLPYENIVVVPRHPIEQHRLANVKLPSRLRLVNTMGQLASIYASSRLTVMGRVFSKDGEKPDDDHNPLEATVGSNTLCGINNKIPEAYGWLYRDSGLVHQFGSVHELIGRIEEFYRDPDIPKKLRRRRQWIKTNSLYLQENLPEILGI